MKEYRGRRTFPNVAGCVGLGFLGFRARGGELSIEMLIQVVFSIFPREFGFLPKVIYFGSSEKLFAFSSGRA